MPASTGSLGLNTAALAGAGSVTSTDPDVSAWITAVGAGNTNPTEVNILTIMVVAMKADGSWAKLDRLWMFALGTQAAALVDLVARASATLPVAPTFTAQKGFTGDGSSQYINSGYNPAVNGVKYLQSDASFGAWVQTNDSRTSNPVYAGNGSLNNFSRQSATQTNWTINNSAGNTSTGVNPTNGIGLQHLDRTAAGASALYHNGVSLGTAAIASAALISLNVFVLGLNNAGTPANFNNGTLGAAFFGGSMGATIAGNFYTDMHTALTAINATNFP